MTNTHSSANLDHILKELEERFASTAPSSKASKKKKQSRYPLQKLLGAIAFVIITAGIASAAYLVQSGQDTRRSADATPIVNVTSVAGFECNGTECKTADNWTHERWKCPILGGDFGDQNGCNSACEAVNNKTDQCYKSVSTPVTCKPDVKVARFYCANGLTSGKCTELFTDVTNDVKAQIGSPMAPGKWVNMDVLMPNKCGSYQFDFQEPGTPDNSYSSPCGAVTYTYDTNCDGTPTNPNPSTPPAPSCNVSVSLRQHGQPVEITNNYTRVDYNAPFTLRARVSNVQNGTVQFVRFSHTDSTLFSPAAVVDRAAPYDATFTAQKIAGGKILAQVRFNGKDDPVCSTELTIRAKGSCNDVCSVDEDCRVAQNLRCLAVAEGGKRCRVPEYPSSATCVAPTPTPVPSPTATPQSSTPTPKPIGLCIGITMANQTRPNQSPAAGDMIKLTCGAVPGASRYRFRIAQPNGTVVALSPSDAASNASQSYLVPSGVLGRFIAQCSACSTAQDTSCTAWESL